MYEWKNEIVNCFDGEKHYELSYVISKNFNSFPIREGEYKIITEFIGKPEYGIYHCIISNPQNTKCKLFRFNPLNKYTHIDINLAKQYN